MTFSRNSRRWITPAVLAGYVLVITFSGLFHQHGSGDCCDGNGCSLQASSGHPPESACSGHHRHHHDHSEAGHCHHGAEHAPSEHAPPADQSPRSDDPLKHSNCAACQLLAEQSLIAPVFVLECSGIVVYRHGPAHELRVLPVSRPAHPARGPPSHG